MTQKHQNGIPFLRECTVHTVSTVDIVFTFFMKPSSPSLEVRISVYRYTLVWSSDMILITQLGLYSFPVMLSMLFQKYFEKVSTVATVCMHTVSTVDTVFNIKLKNDEKHSENSGDGFKNIFE